MKPNTHTHTHTQTHKKTLNTTKIKKDETFVQRNTE